MQFVRGKETRHNYLLRGEKDLTWSNLRHLLEDDNEEEKVMKKPLEQQGVLSEVWNVRIGNDNDWIVKFARNSSQKELFRVESNFYQQFGNEKPFSFFIPKPLYTSETCIILERITNVTSYSLLEGCPIHHVKPILSCLAKMHLQHWNSKKVDLQVLSSNPGIGSNLNGLTKEQLFSEYISDWIQFTNYPSSEQLQTKFATICHELKRRKIRTIHTHVHTFRPALIHGDFHIANLLLDDSTEPCHYWCIDWATCGIGNPLIDFAFFLLVSGNEETSQNMISYLQHYYTTIISSTTCVDWCWEECLEMYYYVILNQLCILVAYHKFASKISQGNTNLQKHFQNVNRRCIQAILSCSVDDDPIHSLLTTNIPLKSSEDFDNEKSALPHIQVSL